MPFELLVSRACEVIQDFLLGPPPDHTLVASDADHDGFETTQTHLPMVDMVICTSTEPTNIVSRKRRVVRGPQLSEPMVRILVFHRM